MIPDKANCRVEGCDRNARTKGCCHAHYKRIWRRGTLQLPTREDRFWAKVDKSGDCWTWTAAQRGGGYGAFTYQQRRTMAHRVSYEMHNGPIPAGMMVDHVCHNKLCVNPAHLRLASCKQNGENRIGPASNNHSSGVRGVHRSGARWRASLKHHGKTISAGTYDTIEQAERAVVEARKRYYTHDLSSLEADQ